MLSRFVPELVDNEQAIAKRFVRVGQSKIHEISILK